MRIAAAALLALGATTARAACPTPSGPWPASYAYVVEDGRRTATASATLPWPADVVAPVAAAVKAEPTWTNAVAKAAPGRIGLRRMLEEKHLQDRALDLEASPDAACPGSSVVTARLAWRYGAMARLMGGDAKDLPALLPLALRDEVIARLLEDPARAAAFPAATAPVLRRAPSELDLPAEAATPLKARLSKMAADGKTALGDFLAALLDMHRAATAISGLTALTDGPAGRADHPVAAGPDGDLSYALVLEEDGEGSSFAFTIGSSAP